MGIQGGLNAAGMLLIGFFLLPILPIVVSIVGAAAYKAYKNQPFMNEGPKTVALFRILAGTALLVTLCRFFFATGGAGSISGGMSVVDNLELLIVAALVILYPVSLVYRRYTDKASAEEFRTAMAKHAAAQRGAGSGRFFLDEDE